MLALFGGVGIVLYLLGWMLLPSEGDTAAPVEAVLGRGRSGTPTVLTIIISIAILLSFGAVFEAPRPGLLGGVLAVVAVVLLLRDTRGRNRTVPAAPYPPPGPYPAYPPMGAPMTSPMASSPTASTPTVPGAPQDAPTYAPPPYAPPPPPYGGPPLYGPPPTGPFAPRGPFVPVGPPPPVPPMVPPMPMPRPPKPPKQRSRLFGLVLSVILIVIGGVYAIDQSGFNIPVSGYFAAGLTVIGLGLVVGAWYGRARGLIALGILTTVALGASSADIDGPRTGTHTYAPASVSQLQSTYSQDIGDMVIDLSKVDFQGQNVSLNARVDLGNLKIVVNSTVDVTVDASVDVGNAEVFGDNWNGLGMDRRTVTNEGSDGPGGGTLHIIASVDAGNLEVHR